MRLSITVSSLLFLVLAITVPNITFATPPIPVQENQPARAQYGSLVRVPQTAGMYFSTMNHTALVEAFFESNAWASIKDSEVSRGMKKAYRRGRTRGYADYNEDNPFSQYLKAYGDYVDNFIVKSGWEIAKQVIENEIFVYVDKNVIQLVDASQRIQEDILNELKLDEFDRFDSELSEEDAAKLVAVFAKHFRDVDCPTIMLGSRLNDPEGFRGLLQLLRATAEEGIKNLPAELEFVEETWEVFEEDDHFLLSANIELAKLPWDEIMVEIEDEQLASAIVDIASNKRATIGLGIVDDLLLFGIAQDHERLVKFGEGPRLIDLPELAKLSKAVDRNETITSVSYVSEEYAKLALSLEELVDSQSSLIRPLILQIDEIPDDEKEALITRIENDIDEIFSDWGQVQPGQGMQYGFTTLGSDGIRGYSLRRSIHPLLDSSKPLNLATHASSNTLAFMVQRPDKLAEQYAFGANLASKIYGYVQPEAERQILEADRRAKENRDELEEPGSENDETESTEAPETTGEDKTPDIAAVFDGFESFFTSIDQTTHNRVLPAIEGQEAGFFVELVAGPNPWHPELPTTEKPLPIPVPALIVGTNDASAFVTGSEEYWSALEQLVEILKANSPDAPDNVRAVILGEDTGIREGDVLKPTESIASVPIGDEFELIAPERITHDAGVSFRWSLLSDLGKFDSSVRMGTLVSDDWIVFNLLPEQAKQLIKTRKQDLFGPAASEASSQTKMFFDNRVMMNGIRSWLAAVEQLDENRAAIDLSQYEAERDTLQFSEEQLRDALDRMLKLVECWKGFSVRSYTQSDATITETLFKFEDIAPPKQ